MGEGNMCVEVRGQYLQYLVSSLMFSTIVLRQSLSQSTWCSPVGKVPDQTAQDLPVSIPALEAQGHTAI